MRRIYWNEDWKFTPQDEPKLREADGDCSGMETVRLPHTAKELPFHYFDESEYQMECGYRKEFTAPLEWRGKRVFLTIEGAAHSSEVYLNGRKLSEHHCGYTSFTTELTEQLVLESKNVLYIRVDSRESQNIPPFGFVVDYMTYGGIYRDVYLEIKEPEYLRDVFVKTEFSDDLSEAWTVSRIEVEKAEQEKRPLRIRQILLDGSSGETVREWEPVPVSKENLEIKEKVSGIRLWDLDSPNLYCLKTQLLCGDELIDQKTVRFGFRKAEFRADGFYLNQKKRKLRGLNRHQSYPYVGYAMPESMQKRDADILKKELGCNAVRTSHYPQSHYFIDRCDEIGLLVFMEIPGWQHIGDAKWKDQAVSNVKDMVREYRNHTSIILWGVRINESADDDEFYQRTNEAAHALDDSRQTGGVRAHKKSHLLEDVYTYNDFLHDGKAPGCDKKKSVTSDMGKAYLVSEYNGHMYPTKTFDDEEHRVEHALRHANVLDAVAQEEDIAGSFGWCMFDYNTHKDFGSGDRICYHGVMDMFRNPKLAALVYACEQEETPVLELSSSMDIGEHPGCNRGFTYLFTNADSVKMYKNDIFIKEYTHDGSPYRNLSHGPILIDDFIGQEIHKHEDFTPKQAEMITYALNYTATHGYGKYPPKIIGIALKCLLFYRMHPTDAVRLYNKYVGDWGGASTVYRFEAVKNGKVVKTLVKKPMTKMQLFLDVSSEELTEKNSYDVAEVRMRLQDENGNLLSFYNDSVEVSTEGPIEVIGPKRIPLRGGMAGVYVKTTGESGKAALHIEGAGFKSRTVAFTVKK